MKSLIFTSILLVCSCEVANMFKTPSKQNTDVTLSSPFSAKKTFEVFKKYFDAKEKSSPVVTQTANYSNVKTRWFNILGTYCQVNANFSESNGKTVVVLSYRFNVDKKRGKKKFDQWTKRTENYKDTTVKDLRKLYSRR